MKKYVVVSANNPDPAEFKDYLFYLPYIEKAWNSLGWDLCLMITHDVPFKETNNHGGQTFKTLNKNNPDTIVIQLPNIEGLRQATIAQSGRLYAANYLPLDAMIMTSDIDLLPLKDYWHPKPEDITVYGHDLTWRTFYPMGYVAMTGHNWKKYLNCTYDTAKDLERDAKEIGIAYSPDWEKWWNHDWTLLTKRLKPFHDKLTLIDRGQTSKGLALGRIDRADWEGTQDQEWIDAHCENTNPSHPDKAAKFINVFEKVYGKL